MNSNNAILIGAIVILILAAGAFLYFRPGPAGVQGQGSSSVAVQRPLKTYYDERYGIAFNFPDNYTVQDHDSTERTKHHTIVIGDKDALAKTPQNGEGPMVITIDIYDNPGKQTAEKWIKGNSFSNYKLSQDAQLASTTVAGVPALAYPWDGLYHSTSIVFPKNGKIYMMSVNYNSPSDQLYKDFAGVVASVQFDQ